MKKLLCLAAVACLLPATASLAQSQGNETNLLPAYKNVISTLVPAFLQEMPEGTLRLKGGRMTVMRLGRWESVKDPMQLPVGTRFLTDGTILTTQGGRLRMVDGC